MADVDAAPGSHTMSLPGDGGGGGDPPRRGADLPRSHAQSVSVFSDRLLIVAVQQASCRLLGGV